MKTFGIMLCSITAFLAAEQSKITCNTLQRFILANYYQFGSQLDQANYWYDQAKEDADAAGFYVGYVPFLESSGKLQEIIPLIPKLDSSFKNHIEIQSTIAHALDASGKANDAQDRLIKLNDAHKTNQELAFKVAQIYLMRQEPENALTVINNVLNTSPRKPNNFIFHFLKAQINLLMNNKQEARDAIKVCIEQYPKFDKGWLLYAVIEEQAGRIDQAISGFTSFLESTAEKNSEIEQHLLQLAAKQKLASTDDISRKNCLAQAMHHIEKKEYRKALAALDECKNKDHNAMQAQLAKMQVYMAEKNFDKVYDALIDGCNASADSECWVRSAHLAYQAGMPIAKTISVFDYVLRKQPKNLNALLYKIDILLRNDDTKKALPELSKACNACTNNQIKARILYQQAMIYYQNKQHTLIEKVLTQACECDITFAPSFNLLAYHYAHDTKKLDKAEQMLQVAQRLDPENPHFVDTLALIRYKQKSYDQALVLLEKSILECPHDTTMLKHLGKTLYKLGKREQALQTVRTAQAAAQQPQEKSKLNALIARWSKQNS